MLLLVILHLLRYARLHIFVGIAPYDVKILRQLLRRLVRRQGEKLCCQRDNIAVLSAAVTMEMCGVEFLARRFLLV